MLNLLSIAFIKKLTFFINLLQVMLIVMYTFAHTLKTSESNLEIDLT